MATFSEKAFSADRYQAYRPVAPAQLFETVYSYHAPAGAPGKWDLCVDLGCGTGFATREVAKHFKEVVGVDVSEPMLKTAREASAGNPSISFVASKAEELPFLKDGSVDLITASQSSHWFNYPKLWPELGRVLKPGGSVAFWVYPQMFLADYPDLNPGLSDFITSPTKGLGGYLEQPGTSILLSLLELIHTPGSPFEATSVRRIKYTGPHFPEVKDPEPIIFKRRMSWDEFKAWINTLSSVHNYHKEHPEDKERPDGDIADRFIRDLRQAVVERGGDGEIVELDQPISLLLLKKEEK